MANRRLMYIELKAGGGGSGPAWICSPKFSKSGQTVYFNGMALKKGSGISGNHFDLITGDEYWISGAKKNGGDRHWAGGGIVMVDAKILDEYLAYRRSATLDEKLYRIVDDIIETDIQKFKELENQALSPTDSDTQRDG